MQKKFEIKEWFILGVEAFYLLALGVILGVPFYDIKIPDTTTYIHNKTYFDFLFSRESKFVISGSVVLGLTLLFLVVGLFFAIKSLSNYKNNNDKEDKFFVYSTVMNMAGMATIALYCLTNYHYIPMAIGLVAAAGGFGAIYYHYKKLISF
ncbi:MAG: hypothetical protein SPL02_00035 [Bacilli bacterium]|nr:hypothetical protein [Bacilli bacterium]MDY6430557.1 hypothetical protein [Bacilli bacterium]